MTNETKHTPTPWDYFVGNANGRGLIRIEQQGTGVHISSLARGVISEANAAHIVKCVNMHDELVEALKKVFNHSLIRLTGDVEPLIENALKKAGAL